MILKLGMKLVVVLSYTLKGIIQKAVLSRSHGQTIDDLMEVANYLHH